jgi:hypothetical protein
MTADMSDRMTSIAGVVAVEAEQAEAIATLLAVLDAVLSDEPTLDPVPPSTIWRWYSEGWNRCARDIRAALAKAKEATDATA